MSDSPPRRKRAKASSRLERTDRHRLDTLEDVIHPKHTVLIVHEMLNAFISPGGKFDKLGKRIDASDIVGPMARLLGAARSSGVRVAYLTWTSYADGRTQNIWTRPHSAGPQHPPGLAAQYNDSGWGAPEAKEHLDDSVIDGSWGAQVADSVKPEAADWVIKKYRPDAFFATPLDAFLRWNGMRTIIIVGIGAEVGIVPTLMTAANLGYLRVAVVDCIRPTKPTRIDDALRYIRDYAIVRTHSEIIDAWKASGRA